MRKLVSWNWDYVTAGLIAQDIAEKCYLAPYDIHVQILRDATDRYRFPDPDDVLPILQEIRHRRKADFQAVSE